MNVQDSFIIWWEIIDIFDVQSFYILLNLVEIHLIIFP